MCISQGISLDNPSPYSGAHVFSLLLMICNFIVKAIILICANKHFGELGGTWAMSANFTMGNAASGGDNAYANMSAGRIFLFLCVSFLCVLGLVSNAL